MTIRYFYSITRHFAGRIAEATVGDADHGAPSHRLRFFVGLHSLRQSSLTHANRSLAIRSLNVSNDSLDAFDDFTARFVRAKVRKLIGRAGFTESDRPDLIQEFVIDLLQRQRKFDPTTATWEAFVVVVCENHYVTILQHRHAEMRSHEREAGSVNRPVVDAEGTRTSREATISESEHGRRTGQQRRSDEEIWDLAHDIAQVVEQMTPTMRKVCEILKRDSKATAARELGMSRGALYETIDRIVARFEKAGLRDYVK